MIEDLKNVKIKNKRLKIRLLSTVSGLMTQLAKLYKDEQEEVKKVLAIIIAVILIQGYDNDKELNSILKEIKNKIKEKRNK